MERHELSAYIRDFRIRHGMTMVTLAQHLGCSVSQVSKYESGRHTPQATSLYKVLRVLDRLDAEKEAAE